VKKRGLSLVDNGGNRKRIVRESIELNPICHEFQ
jgi:hypothetical protein